MPWICTGTPSGQPEPNSDTGRQGVEEQRPPRTRPGLRQLLRRHDAQREAGVDELGGQLVGGPDAAPEDLVEADLPGVADSGIQGVERAAVIAVRRVHGVTGAAQFVGERHDARRESVRVVEQHYFSHLDTPLSLELRTRIKHLPSSARRRAAPDR